MLKAWHGEAVPCTRGLVVWATKSSEDGFSVWASKPRPEARRDGNGIRVRREASKRDARNVIEELASEVSKT